MASGRLITARKNNKICIDCGKRIKIGEKYSYHYDSKNKKKYIYCKLCKEKPEHNKNRHDYKSIYKYIRKNPLFKHQFQEKYDIKSPSQAHELIRRIMYNGYPIKIFRWSMQSRKSKIGEKENYRSGFQPNNFIIYYVQGSENRVVSKIMEEFNFDHIRWRDLLGSLYGQKIPIAMTNKEAIIQWANQNVYN